MRIGGMNKIKYTKHDHKLNDIIKNLYDIDESSNSAVCVLKEPIWYKKHNNNYNSLCDLIILYDSYGVPIEYKNSEHNKDKAISQIIQGKLFCENILGYKVNYGKFVYSLYNELKFDKIELR